MNKRFLRKEWIAPLLCGATALIVRVPALKAFQQSVFYRPLEGGAHDRSVYLDAIRNAADGHFFPPGAFEFLPLYPWLAGILSFLFGDAAAVSPWFGIACDTLTAALVVVFARRLGASAAVAVIAGLLYAFYPPAVTYSLLNMPNTLNALGVLVFACAAHALLEPREKRPARRTIFCLGLFAGVMTLGFAGMLLMAATAVILMTIRTKSAVPAGIFLAGLIIPIAPIALHNSKAEGRLVLLTTHGGFNYYMGNNEHATGYPLRLFNFRMTAKSMLEDAHRFAEKETGRTMTRAESSAWWKKLARTYWRDHPGGAAALTFKKAALFWNQAEVDDLRMLEQLRITDPFFRKFPGVPFAVFGMLGLVGLLHARGATVPRWLLIAGMIGLVMFFITARYRLTFVPLMAALGAAGMCRVSHEWQAGRRMPLLTLIPVIALVCWPIRLRDLRPVDYHNAAVQLTAAGRYEEAMNAAMRGLEIDPGLDQLHAAKGAILFAADDFQGAADAFAAARLLNPNNAGTSYNLALSLARAGRYCGARDSLSEARDAGFPLDDRGLMLLRELDAACETQATQ